MNTTRRRFLILAAGGGMGALAGLLHGSRPASATCAAASRETRAAGGLFAAQRTSRALGSEISMAVLHRKPGSAAAALDAAFAELELVEELMSLYRPHSALCRLNRSGALCEPHPYLVSVLTQAQAVSAASGGAFDVTVQPLWKLYAAAHKEGRLPDLREVEATRRLVGWQRLDVDARRIQLASPGMAVTLNGIAQGFAADRALAALRRHGVAGALVNTGELGSLGRKADGSAWKVGIQHPRVEDAYIELAQLDGRCLSTSGDYATAFSADRAYNHIFDPRTGSSPPHYSSVSVVADSAAEADALSTALFVLPPSAGDALLKTYASAEALFVTKSGTVRSTRSFPSASQS
ncbi:MAG: FAD:protein FMN transferase [Planctomycetes bacterium]|nr:FAD:protein FMN transferase [Planctomycetota bacterium]